MSTASAPLPLLIGLVAGLAVVGCSDDDEPSDDGQVTAASGANDTGSTSGSTGEVVTTINESLTDAGGADYGGSEFGEEGEEVGEESAGTDTGQGTETGGSGTGGSDTGGTDTAGSTGTGATSVGEMTTTDGGGADYGGAPPAEPKKPF